MSLYTGITCICKPVLPQTIAAYLGQLALASPALRETVRTTDPSSIPSGEAAQSLHKAALERIKKVGNESPRAQNLHYLPNVPESTKEGLTNSVKYAGYTRGFNPNDPTDHAGGIAMANPLASREILAHEFGHHISDNTELGHKIANLRHNPKTAKALAGAVLGLPFLQSALQAGDDDAASGVAIAALLSSPTLIDEALATKNGLAILEDAGMKATAAQRGRLAGAYLSYAAAPVVAGLVGNTVGNVVDDYTALYDL